MKFRTKMHDDNVVRNKSADGTFRAAARDNSSKVPVEKSMPQQLAEFNRASAARNKQRYGIEPAVEPTNERKPVVDSGGNFLVGPGAPFHTNLLMDANRRNAEYWAKKKIG